jgi:hypothetical protein
MLSSTTPTNTRTMKTIVHIGIVMSLFSISTVVAPAATILTFGGPGYVSQGLTYTYPGAGSSASSRNGVSVNFFFFSGGNQCYIDFSAPRYTLLEVGMYNDIIQYVGQPMFGKPSLNIMNNGKALSPIPEGWFEVLEIAIDPIYGVPTKVAIDFFTKDSAGQPTGGSLRWGSNIPATPINQIIPEVSTSFFLIGGIGLGLCRRRRT